MWEFTFYGPLNFFKIYVFISRLELGLRRLRFDYIYFFFEFIPHSFIFFFLDINYTWLKYLRNHDHHHFLSSFFYFGITLDKNSDYFIEKMRGRREKHVAYYRSDIHWVLSIWILMFVLRAFTYIQMFRLNKSKCNIVCQDILCTCNHSSRCVYIFSENPLHIYSTL